MKTVTLTISDDYFERIISFLKMLPKKAIQFEEEIEQKKEKKKIEKHILSAVDDIKYGRTKKIRTII